MNLQPERIEALCVEMKLQQIPRCYESLADAAVRREASYSDFLETQSGSRLSR